jgi:spore coat polysaccharide biosynthesis protein SpsF (cytidylyltransferase family)
MLLCIIQARLGSTRLPNKVMQTVGGVPMVRRVWLAAKASLADKVVVAWPERYPDLDENNVLERFQRIVSENHQCTHVIRLTADCPLITHQEINNAIRAAEGRYYYNNRKDGLDVQVFNADLLWNVKMTDREHVINDKPNTGGLSVNTRTDLAIVRSYVEQQNAR